MDSQILSGFGDSCRVDIPRETEDNLVNLPMTFIARTFAFCSSLVVLFGGCTRSLDGVAPSTLHVAQSDDVLSWDPVGAYDSVSLDALSNVYETLYQFSYLSKDYEIVPLLAADLPKISNNGLVITIPIRQDLTFQDDPCFVASKGKGRQVKASDFIYSWKRLADPELLSQNSWVIENKIKGFDDFKRQWEKQPKATQPNFIKTSVSGLKAIDDFTLQIELTRPHPRFINVLTLPALAVIPAEAIRHYGEERGGLAANPVGTGPFRLDQWDRGRKIVLKKNPNFHPEFYPTAGSDFFREKGLLQDAGKRLPLVDRIELHVIRESQERWTQFQKGTLDRILIPKEAIEETLVNQTNLSPRWVSRGVRLSVDPAPAFYHLTLNLRDPVLSKNKLLRQALSSSIDREKWIQSFTGNTGRIQTHALPPEIPGRTREARLKYDFDLSRARSLLARAGFPHGKGLPPLVLELRGNDTEAKKLGDFFIKQFKAIGVTLKVHQNSFQHFLDKVRKNQFQIAYGGWAMDTPDAENVFQLLYGFDSQASPNEAGFGNTHFNHLFEQLVQTSSIQKRSELIKQLDDLIQEELPWIYGYYLTEHVLSQPWLLNQRAAKLIQGKYKYYRIDPEVKTRYQTTK